MKKFVKLAPQQDPEDCEAADQSKTPDGPSD
jgi:hypothetical protein